MVCFPPTILFCCCCLDSLLVCFFSTDERDFYSDCNDAPAGVALLSQWSLVQVCCCLEGSCGFGYLWEYNDAVYVCELLYLFVSSPLVCYSFVAVVIFCSSSSGDFLDCIHTYPSTVILLLLVQALLAGSPRSATALAIKQGWGKLVMVLFVSRPYMRGPIHI